MRVSVMSVNGVESVKVSLDKGLAEVKLKPGNSVTLEQLQQAIAKNGFTMKQSQITAAGKVIHDGGSDKFQISGSNETLTLQADAGATAAAGGGSGTMILKGMIPEGAKGKVPDTVRYQSIAGEK